MENGTLSKIRNWTYPDGRLAMTFYVNKAMRKDETEDEFIKRVDDKILRDRPEFKEMRSTLDEISSLPDMNFKHKFRRDPNGKIFIDHSIRSSDELAREKADQLQQKKSKLRIKLLQTFSNLTQEEVDLLLS